MESQQEESGTGKSSASPVSVSKDDCLLMSSPPLLVRGSVHSYWPGVVLSAAMLLCVIAGLIALWQRGNASPFFLGFLAIIGLAMGYAGVGFFRLVRMPPLLMEANAEGILSYYNSERSDYSAPGHRIPWEVIECISVRRDSASMGGDTVRVQMLHLHLRPGHGLPVKKWSQLTTLFDGPPGSADGIDWENSLFLQAVTDYGKPEALAAALEELRRSSRPPS